MPLTEEMRETLKTSVIWAKVCLPAPRVFRIVMLKVTERVTA